LLAAVPVAAVVHLGLDEPAPTGLACAGLMLVTTVWSSTMLRRRPRAATVVAATGTAAFLTLLCAAFLPALSESLLGARTARRVALVADASEPVLIHRLRDEELLFALPLGVRVTRSPEALEDRLDGLSRALIVVRETDLGDVRAALHPVAPVVVDRVNGIDLGHGRWATNLLIRVDQVRPDPDRRGHVRDTHRP
jgi:hypothetical protein